MGHPTLVFRSAHNEFSDNVPPYTGVCPTTCIWPAVQSTTYPCLVFHADAMEPYLGWMCYICNITVSWTMSAGYSDVIDHTMNSQRTFTLLDELLSISIFRILEKNERV